eukprot:372829-Pleurochrysis_carterae.AAC.1
MSVPAFSTGATNSCWSRWQRACVLKILSSIEAACLSSSSARTRTRSASNSDRMASNSAREWNTFVLEWQQCQGVANS